MTVAADKVSQLMMPSGKNQEILGSVTQETSFSDRPFSIQLRTSARVSKNKLKLDSQNVAAPVSTEKKETKPEENKIAEPSKSNTVRRVHELWSTEDKNAFFEALNEYGKDFDAIQTHMNNKRKKRGISQNISKNRDQARHFYYRTWHKISKYLKFPQEVKKAVREQYGLINFGEFRKKIGFVSEKNNMKLNELIYSGNTQVRIKGKSIRIKTPVCRALRKLNQLQETTDVKLPTRIVIELRPRNKESWCHVQSLAMNPRVRTSLPLQQQLISLVSYLQKKWQLPNNETIEKHSPACGESACGDPHQLADKTPLLRIAPRQGISIVAPSVRSGEFITSSRISLLAYEEKFGAGKEAIEENLKQTVNKSAKSGRNCKRVQAEDEKSKPTSENDIQLQTASASDGPLSDSEVVSSTMSQLLALQHEIDSAAKYGNEDPDWNSPGKDEFELDTEITTSENKEEIIQKAKAGWTVENSDAIRVGDLYLMFGADCKLQLDYWWEKEDCQKTEENKLSTCDAQASPEKNKLSESLNKLISIAKLYLNKDKGNNNCSCGHVCKPNNKFINGRNRFMKRSRTSTSSCTESDRSGNTPISEQSLSKPFITPTISRTNAMPHVASRGVSSFKEQLNLQYYNRRRIGDKQRPPSLPNVTVQVIKPKEDVVPEEPQDLDIDSVSVDGPHEVDTNLNESSESAIIPNQLPSFLSNNVEVPSRGTNVLCSNLSLQDEDSKSSCSTITRFLNQTLPKVIPQPITPSSDGINTPVISRMNNLPLLTSDNLQSGRESPTWCMSEASNFSISSLLRQLETAAKTPIINTVPVDEETRFSADVETQFQRLINESSVDYTEKFANLAAQIASETTNQKT